MGINLIKKIKRLFKEEEAEQTQTPPAVKSEDLVKVSKIFSIRVFADVLTDRIENIIWLEDMPIYKYMGVKGLYARRNADTGLCDKVVVIEEDTMYDINTFEEGNDNDEKLDAIKQTLRDKVDNLFNQ